MSVYSYIYVYFVRVCMGVYFMFFYFWLLCNVFFCDKSCCNSPYAIPM